MSNFSSVTGTNMPARPATRLLMIIAAPMTSPSREIVEQQGGTGADQQAERGGRWQARCGTRGRSSARCGTGQLVGGERAHHHCQRLGAGALPPCPKRSASAPRAVRSALDLAAEQADDAGRDHRRARLITSHVSRVRMVEPIGSLMSPSPRPTATGRPRRLFLDDVDDVIDRDSCRRGRPE